MKDYQKTTLLDSLETMEKHIQDMKEGIASIAMDPRYGTSVGETIASYAAKLNGYILKRQGFCYALSVLGYRVEWDGEHAVDIVKEVEA